MSHTIVKYNYKHNDTVSNCYTLSVPLVQSEVGKKAFIYAAPSDWNLPQSNLKFQSLLSLDHFKRVILQMEFDSTTSNCFKWL